MVNRTFFLSLAAALTLLAPIVTMRPGVAATPASMTIYVSPSGNDSADGHSPRTALRTIGHALGMLPQVPAAAGSLPSGARIILAPGTYSESAATMPNAVIADFSLIGDESGTLTGHPKGPVIVRAADPMKPGIALTNAPATITGLTFAGPGQGLAIANGGVTEVLQCTFDSLIKGISATGTSAVVVSSSTFVHCAVGASFNDCTNVSVTNDTVTGSTSIGLLILGGGNGEIRSCILADNNASLIVDSASARTWTSDYNILSGTPGAWGDAPAISNAYEWYGATKQDRHSNYVAPVFVNAAAGDVHIDPHVSWGGGLPIAPRDSQPNAGKVVLIYDVVDRDGKPISPSVSEGAGGRICGAYNYPQPVATGAWKELNAKVPQGVRISAAVYKPGPDKNHPILVRTLVADSAGVEHLWWDGRDDYGQSVPAGQYQVIAIASDARLMDDGSIANDGNPEGQYANYNAERLLPLPDGGWIETQSYAESGYNLRRYDSTGRSTYASAQSDGSFWATALYGGGITARDIIAGIDSGTDAKLVMLRLPGERAKLFNGADSYPILTPDEKTAKAKGLAVVGEKAYVSLMGVNLIRVIDLVNGQKVADWPVPDLGDLTSLPDGTLVALSGTNLDYISSKDGSIIATRPTGLVQPQWLAACQARCAAIDTNHGKIAILDNANRAAAPKIIGKDRTAYFMPVAGDLFRDPQGAGFLADGRLGITEFGRTRLLDVDDPAQHHDIVADFLDVGITHPIDKRYVYTGLGIFQVDYATGTWKWVVEVPSFSLWATKPEDDPWNDQRYAPARTVVLSGRPFLVSHNGDGTARFYDISDPLHPRVASTVKGIPAVYETLTFDKAGDLVYQGTGTLSMRVAPYKGLDSDNNPTYDTTQVTEPGPKADPDTARGMKNVWSLTSDHVDNDIYYLAVSKDRDKLVPGWGADGTGIGKTLLPGGVPEFFSPSSGGTYMSIAAVNDGTGTWVLACKSLGGQIDVFDPYGLRVTTSNWDEKTGYQNGFVDTRYGLDGYLRPDGKVGAYIEDDAIGRLTRVRLDGANTLERSFSTIDWSTSTPSMDASIPDPGRPDGAAAAATATIPRVASLPMDGDWSKWAGVQPQIVLLPGNIAFHRTVPPDLFKTFDEATAIGAVAHDNQYLYAYFVVANANPHFDQTDPASLWRTDGIEFWVEEEQFGLSMLASGAPAIYKWRFHDATGAEWHANYSLPSSDIWAQKISDLSTHPLGAQLAMLAGVSMKGMPGYAVEARIPYNEIRLVGGIAGRQGGQILPTTGKEGEVIRIAVALDKVNATGRVQDFMTDWPVSMMYSDPTRSYPFTFSDSP